MRKLRKLGGVAVLTLAFGAHCFAGIISTPPEAPPAPEPSPQTAGIIECPPSDAATDPVVIVALEVLQIVISGF